jgi:hypothetical protein
MMQFSRGAVRYIFDIWNWVDMIPIVLCIYLVSVSMQAEFVPYYDFYLTLAVCSLFFMLRLLSLLRIFQDTGYLIHSIKFTIISMGAFLLIFILMVLGFAFTFAAMSNANALDPDSDLKPFIENTYQGIKFSLMMSLADWDYSQFDENTFIIFLLAVLVEVIVMLNVLIAIVSNAF